MCQKNYFILFIKTCKYNFYILISFFYTINFFCVHTVSYKNSWLYNAIVKCRYSSIIFFHDLLSDLMSGQNQDPMYR